MPADLLKVLIVDDEYLIRDLLKDCIPWNDIGMEVVGEAQDALEALKLVEQLLPDIIITDICMPFMDGIEFSRNVVEKYLNIKIIVLTGYDEFEYAKISIKVGISDFILKPIDEDEIKAALLKLKVKIEDERGQKEEYRRLKEQIRENLPYLREKYFNELIQRRLEPEEIQRKFIYFEIPVKEECFQVAVIEAYAETGFDEKSEEERLFLTVQCLNLVRQYFRDDIYVHIFLDDRSRIVLLKNDDQIDMVECCENIKAMIINRLKCYACIGIGNSASGVSDICISYKEALSALNYRFIAGKNHVINFSEISVCDEERMDFLGDNLENLGFCLRTGMREKTFNLIDEYFEHARRHRSNIYAVKIASINIVSIILNVVIEMNLDIKGVFRGESNLVENILKLDTLPDIKAFLYKQVEAITSVIGNMRTKKTKKIVEDILDYIVKNITDSELSLSVVAKAFYIHPNYLSRIFKEETAQNFVEYITKLRMEKAINLLKQTNMKAYEIAEKVGIEDPHYFGICFKKYTGFSVNDFRKG